MKIGFAYCASPTIHGRLIRLITKGKFNHALVWFEGTEGDIEPVPAGERVYFESSTFTADGDGVHGPHPWDKLTKWLDKDHGNRIESMDLPYDDWRVQRAWGWCNAAAGTIGYPCWQLIRNASMCLLGWRIRHADPKEWTCCETAARLWAWIDPGLPGDPGPASDILGIGDVTFDSVTPSGKYGLYEAHKTFLSDAKGVIQ